MKKWLAIVGMITCIFGLTACGSEETLTEYEQQKADYATQLASQQIIPFLVTISDDSQKSMLTDYTNEELAYIISNQYSINVDGYAVKTAADSFGRALEQMGSINDVIGTTVEMDGNQIIVLAEVEGEKRDAEAEIIFSNDLFMKLESAALNPKSSKGELMSKAALNTLIGMGTVFIVLILISFIISALGIIPKLQNNMAEKKAAKQANVDSVSGIENAVAQIVDREEAEDVSGDLELVAVIAAAIAAYEGASSTDGFVVRSIHRVGRGR
ncbi:MAG: OadG family protein [Acetatifactor sp.]|nr:OadG family protein [Acetatifactor sp.]